MSHRRKMCNALANRGLGLLRHRRLAVCAKVLEIWCRPFVHKSSAIGSQQTKKRFYLLNNLQLRVGQL
jgi:hypothetical protein